MMQNQRDQTFRQANLTGYECKISGLRPATPFSFVNYIRNPFVLFRQLINQDHELQTSRYACKICF